MRLIWIPSREGCSSPVSCSPSPNPAIPHVRFRLDGYGGNGGSSACPSATGIAGLEELRISESRADTIRTQARTQAAQDRADGIGVYAATSPQPMRTVPPEPEEDDRDWSLVRPADMDEQTDHPSHAGSRRN